MNVVPPRGGRIVLAMLPFILIAITYVIGSAERRAANPYDKLLPPVSEMAATTNDLRPSRTGDPESMYCGSTPRRACSGSRSDSAFRRRSAWRWA
jgi:hypothetical protein